MRELSLVFSILLTTPCLNALRNFNCGFSTQRGLLLCNHVKPGRSLSVFPVRKCLAGCNGSTSLTISSIQSRCQDYITKHTKESLPLRLNILQNIVGYINNLIVGTLFMIILRVLNSLRTFRLSTLLDFAFHRPKGVGLLTVSNHQSVADDPGLWSAILPYWRLSPERLRWSLCTHDVFFYRPWLTAIMATGNTMPLDRKGSLEQPLFQLYLKKLSHGAWCHIFPEGRVWQNWRFDEQRESVLGPLKWGVGKLIAHSYPNTPVVLPIYHKGMSDIIPEKQVENKKGTPSVPLSIIPKFGRDIKVFVGKPLDFRDKLRQFDAQYPGKLSQWRTSRETLRLYGEITEEIQRSLEELEAEAYGRSRPIHNPPPRRRVRNQ